MSYNVQTISASSPSICIPRVFDNITRDFIGKTFDELFGGRYVESIDFVTKTSEKGETFKKVFIHFHSWPTRNREVVAVREKLLAGGEVKIMYDEPWFWKCSASKSARPSPMPRQERERRAPYIADVTPHRAITSRPTTSPRREQRTRHYEKIRPEPIIAPPRQSPVFDEKNAIGDRIYRWVYDLFNSEALAGKITGMLLELNLDELKNIVDSPKDLSARIAEAKRVLDEAYAQAHEASKAKEQAPQTPPRRHRINYVPPGAPVKILKRVLKVTEPETVLEKATNTPLPETSENL